MIGGVVGWTGLPVCILVSLSEVVLNFASIIQYALMLENFNFLWFKFKY